MKILHLDIETAPTTAYVWGLWQQNVGLNQIIDNGHVLSWAAKWHGQSEVMFMSMQTGVKKMLNKVHSLLGQADVVVHYNGQRFDIPILNREFLLHNFTPPAPYKQVDLLKVARNRFRFISNKLDFIANALGLGKKIRHKGFELWVECMANNPESWKQMEEYNRQDVVLLEKLYNVFLPWITNHPAYEGLVCSNCGGSHLSRRGLATTKLLVYQRFQCSDCGKWMRANKSITPKGRSRLIGIQ
jgi:DNA polymerase elongation subunit (family B)